jgi:hypothetical protein
VPSVVDNGKAVGCPLEGWRGEFDSRIRYHASMVELVDTRDLESRAPRACRFDSYYGYQFENYGVGMQ